MNADRRRQFLVLIGEIFAAQGASVSFSSSSWGGRDGGIDLLVQTTDGVVIPIQVKLGASPSVTLSRVRDVSSLTSSLKDIAVGAEPLLVYGAYIEPSRRDWAEQEFKIQIWDREILLQKAGSVRPELERFFEEFIQETSLLSAAPLAPVNALPSRPSVEQVTDPQLGLEGDALIARLGSIPSGRKGAKAYETICQDIINYLFGDDLRDVRPQKRTTDGINIYDLVYRVSPKHPFWVTLTRDFRARVILFECKNYGKPLNAMQIFTTERYLSASALRPICFVLSRRPPHRNAVQAASGAMRDSGKLLVFLSDADLNKMLRAKDAQLKDGGTAEQRQANDPTEVLDQTIYDFIAGMPR